MQDKNFFCNADADVDVNADADADIPMPRFPNGLISFWTAFPFFELSTRIFNVEIITLFRLTTNLFNANTLSTISFGVYFGVPLVPICKIRNSGCLFKIGFKWSYMSVIVAPGNCLTFTNHFWESKLPSIPFNMKSPAMQMVPSGHLLGVSLLLALQKLVFFQVVFQE